MRKPQVKRPDYTRKTAGQAAGAGRFTKLRLLQLLGVTAGLGVAAWANAVGLGGINVASALGQPLKAEIELVAVTKADKPSLVARLASPDAYKGAGLDYPSGIKYSFDVVSRANGDSYLRLSSNREINDPFVSLLVELSWSSGKLMREYTFLLDPPGYVAAQPKSAPEVIPAQVSSAPLTLTPLPAAEEKPESAPVEKAPADKAPEAAVKAQAKSAARPAQKVGTGSVEVKRGDTLNKIAAEVKPADVSLERMLVALYRANADQFDGKNMNRIKTGKILRMPDQGDVDHTTQAEAVREIHAQSADWNAYRQRLAGVATSSHQNEAPSKVATGKIAAPAADKTPVAPESAKEVLRLSKGEAPGDKAGSAGRRVAQDKQNAAAEEEIAKRKALEEEKTRAALLESNLKDMQRLAQLKSEAAALAASARAASAIPAVSEVAPASAVAAASDVVAASAVAPVSHVAAASHVVAASAVPVVAEDEPLLDQLLSSPLMLGIGAAALVAFGGLGIFFSRRKKAKVEHENDPGAKTGQLTTPVVPSPETGDFTAAPVEEVVQRAEVIDPIKEAELFLNFGRDEQAEEVLKDALVHTPDDHRVHLKLLEIYANRQDVSSFDEIYTLLQETEDSDAMAKAAVIAMKLAASGKDKLEDTQNMEQYSELPAAAEVVEELTEPAFDLAVDLPAEPEVTHDHAIDFDVTGLEELPDVDFDVTATSPIAALDLDVAASADVEPAAAISDDMALFEAMAADTASVDAAPVDAALPSLDDLIFDVASAPAAGVEIEEVPAADKPASIEDAMEFTLDFPTDEPGEKTASLPPPINLSDISLDMDDIGTPVAEPAPVEKSERWHEVATKLDLARAYQEMGDEVGAREILDEIVLEGDEQQKLEAQTLISQLG